MRRVFTVIGFSFLLSTIICLNIKLWLQITIISVFVAAFIVSIIIKPLRGTKVLPVVFICIALACGNCVVGNITHVAPAKQLVGKTKDVTAISVALPEFYDGYVKYIFKTEDNIKFTAFFSEDMGVEPYDKITARVKFYEKEGSENYDYGKGIYLRGKAENVTVIPIIPSTKPLNYHILKFRGYAAQTISKYVGGQNGAITKAIVLSDKTGVDRQINQTFKDVGMLHTTAVSGMHVSILISALFFLLTGLKINRKITSAICIGITLMYMAVAGFSFSVSRAGIMVIIMLIGIIIDRKQDALNSLGFAAFLLIVINPYAAINVSFLLSFFATLGMVVLYLPISLALSKRKLNKVATAFITPFLQSLCANIFILPILYIFYGSFSLISPIANAIMFIPISGILNLGLLTVAVSFVPYVAGITGDITSRLASFCISISKWLSSFKFSAISIDRIFVGLWIVSVMLLFVIIALMIAKVNTLPKARIIRVGGYISCIMLACFMLVNHLVNKDITTVTVLNSGNSYCAVMTRGDNAIIIGAGGENAHYAYRNLDERIKIPDVQLMILPDLKNNYSQKAQNVVQWSKPDKIALDNSGDRYYQIKSVAGQERLIVLKDSVINMWDDVVVKPYYLPSSVALWVEIGDTTLLFVDGEASVKLLPEDMVNCNVTIVSGVPQKAEQIKSEHIIACCDQANGFISTGDGNIRLQTRGNGDIKMKRMR